MLEKLNPLDKLSFLNLEKFINIHKPIILILSVACYFLFVIALVLLPLVELWKIFLIYYFIGTLEQIFFHRRFAHRAWEAPKWLDFIGLWLSSLSLLGNTMTYTSHHRLHHRYSDRPLDPHSPYFKKYFDIQFLFPYYVGSLKYATDISSDAFHRFFGTYTLPIIFINWYLIVYMFSIEFLILYWLPGTGLFLLIKNYLNYRLHKPGMFSIIPNSKNPTEKSTNNLLWGYLSFDGWHQNHHLYPSYWYYGRRWWELDIPGIAIGLLSVLTLQFQNFKR